MDTPLDMKLATIGHVDHNVSKLHTMAHHLGKTTTVILTSSRQVGLSHAIRERNYDFHDVISTQSGLTLNPYHRQSTWREMEAWPTCEIGDLDEPTSKYITAKTQVSVAKKLSTAQRKNKIRVNKHRKQSRKRNR